MTWLVTPESQMPKPFGAVRFSASRCVEVQVYIAKVSLIERTAPNSLGDLHSRLSVSVARTNIWTFRYIEREHHSLATDPSQPKIDTKIYFKHKNLKSKN